VNTVERTRIDGKRVEDDWPLAPIHFGAPWEHRPVGPFRAQAWHESKATSLIRHEVHDEFDHVMAAWNRWCVPPMRGYFAFVIDESFTVVAGVSSTTQTLVEHGRYGWWGVRSAWEWMERYSGQDPIDLAVWEATARNQTDG
jgi:hypothetical protein